MKQNFRTSCTAICIFSILFFSGCAGTKVSPNAATLKVDVAWTAGSRCSSTSPEINVEGIPPVTKQLKVNLIDLDKMTYNHGGGTVSYDGSGVIPMGALKSYKGPCPPGGQHRYRIDVKAIDESGTVVGLGKDTQLY